MEGERELMSLGLREVSSFLSLHLDPVPPWWSQPKYFLKHYRKSDTLLIPVGNILYTGLTRGHWFSCRATPLGMIWVLPFSHQPPTTWPPCRCYIISQLLQKLNSQKTNLAVKGKEECLGWDLNNRLYKKGEFYPPKKFIRVQNEHSSQQCLALMDIKTEGKETGGHFCMSHCWNWQHSHQSGTQPHVCCCSRHRTTLQITGIYYSTIFLFFLCFLQGVELFEIKLNSFKIYLKEKILINEILIDLKMFNLPQKSTHHLLSVQP